MATTQPSIAEPLGVSLMLRFPEQYAALSQRLVVLPGTAGKRAWLADLHDPYHPTAQVFNSTAAEVAWRERVH